MITDKNAEFLARYGSAKHIDALLADKNFHDKEFVIKNPHMTPEHHIQLYREGSASAKMTIAASPTLPQELRNEVMNHPSANIRSIFARRYDITDGEFNHMKHDKNQDVIHGLVDEYAKPMDRKLDDRISDIVHNGPDSARDAISKNHELPSHHVYDILGTHHISAISNIAQHNINLNPDHLKTLSEHPDFLVRGRLAMNRELPDHIRSKLENDPHETVREFAKAYK